MDRDAKINGILALSRSDKQIQVQQRVVEFLSLFEILKPIPVSPLEHKADGSDDDDDLWGVCVFLYLCHWLRTRLPFGDYM